MALLIDASLNRAELQRCYRGCSRAFRTALALGGYLALGVTWEQTCQAKDSGADFFAHYALPPWFASALFREILPAVSLPRDSHATNVHVDAVDGQVVCPSQAQSGAEEEEDVSRVHALLYNRWLHGQYRLSPLLMA